MSETSDSPDFNQLLDQAIQSRFSGIYDAGSDSPISLARTDDDRALLEYFCTEKEVIVASIRSECDTVLKVARSMSAKVDSVQFFEQQFKKHTAELKNRRLHARYKAYIAEGYL